MDTSLHVIKVPVILVRF